MTRGELLEFLRRHKLAVVATVTADGAPEAALVGVAFTDALEIVFDTALASRKAKNLRANSRVAVVVGGWEREITAQLEGVAEFPSGEERARLHAAYVAVWPDGEARAASASIGYVRVRIAWARYSDFETGRIEELELA